VLCARDRMEAVARKNPTTREEIESIPELRGWQARELGDDFIKALAPHRKQTASKQAAESTGSPYRD